MKKTAPVPDLGDHARQALYGRRFHFRLPKPPTYFKTGAPAEKVTCAVCQKSLKAKNALVLGADWFHKVCAPPGAKAPEPPKNPLVSMAAQGEAELAAQMVGTPLTLSEEEQAVSPVVGDPIKEDV